jgi:ectoine hydroxylase-related dioxygenase (phytanoyl-CoA dioxygenase family)
MSASLSRPITDAEIETYDRDGAVFLEGVFSDDWITLLQAGLEANRAAPTMRARIYDRDEEDRTFFYDSQAWMGIDEYRRFIFDSPCAEIAGRIMNVSKVNFFFDAIFVRSAGTMFRTPWHQDEPYWSVDGFDACSIWMPLVPVEKKSALEFVRGSHRWLNKFHQRNFAELNPDGEGNIANVDFSEVATEPFPDIDGNRDDYDILSWDMQPGDCVVFNARMIHGGSGQLAGDQSLSVFNTKWLGDDVRVAFRSCGMDPDHTGIMTKYGLKDGDRISTDLYPEIWTRS